LGLDIAGLKHEVRERVDYLPGADRFLTEMRRRQLRTALLTNAHRDALRVKDAQSGLTRYFDIVVSSHDFGVPKESAEFWRQAQARVAFDPSRSLFVDDSLAVLRAARTHGIAQVFAISNPDSGSAPREVTEFPAVAGVADLLDD
ncbi:MAG: HAD-IA family hydrolase, partial [Steroidobacter sp.]